MGLPRFLNNEFLHLKKEILSSNGDKQHVMGWAFYAGAFFAREHVDRLLEKKIPLDNIILDMVKGEFRAEKLKCYIVQSGSKLDKVEYQKYQGLKNDQQSYTRTVTVSEFIVKKLKEIDEQKMLRDLEEVKLRKLILTYQKRVYKSRTFPAKLRQIIFQRDNYCCRICGRHRDFLITQKLHLEVDHIEEWEDGGETSYRNGQTVCSECNKGKHHSKEIMQIKSRKQV